MRVDDVLLAELFAYSPGSSLCKRKVYSHELETRAACMMAEDREWEVLVHNAVRLRPRCILKKIRSIAIVDEDAAAASGDNMQSNNAVKAKLKQVCRREESSRGLIHDEALKLLASIRRCLANCLAKSAKIWKAPSTIPTNTSEATNRMRHSYFIKRANSEIRKMTASGSASYTGPAFLGGIGGRSMLIPDTKFRFLTAATTASLWSAEGAERSALSAEVSTAAESIQAAITLNEEHMAAAVACYAAQERRRAWIAKKGAEQFALLKVNETLSRQAILIADEVLIRSVLCTLAALERIHEEECFCRLATLTTYRKVVTEMYGTFNAQQRERIHDNAVQRMEGIVRTEATDKSILMLSIEVSIRQDALLDRGRQLACRLKSFVLYETSTRAAVVKEEGSERVAHFKALLKVVDGWMAALVKKEQQRRNFRNIEEEKTAEAMFGQEERLRKEIMETLHKRELERKLQVNNLEDAEHVRLIEIQQEEAKLFREMKNAALAGHRRASMLEAHFSEQKALRCSEAEMRTVTEAQSMLLYATLPTSSLLKSLNTTYIAEVQQRLIVTDDEEAARGEISVLEKALCNNVLALMKSLTSLKADEKQHRAEVSILWAAGLKKVHIVHWRWKLEDQERRNMELYEAGSPMTEEEKEVERKREEERLREVKAAMRRIDEVREMMGPVYCLGEEVAGRKALAKAEKVEAMKLKAYVSYFIWLRSLCCGFNRTRKPQPQYPYVTLLKLLNKATTPLVPHAIDIVPSAPPHVVQNTLSEYHSMCTRDMLVERSFVNTLPAFMRSLSLYRQHDILGMLHELRNASYDTLPQGTCFEALREARRIDDEYGVSCVAVVALVATGLSMTCKTNIVVKRIQKTGRGRATRKGLKDTRAKVQNVMTIQYTRNHAKDKVMTGLDILLGTAVPYVVPGGGMISLMGALGGRHAPGLFLCFQSVTLQIKPEEMEFPYSQGIPLLLSARPSRRSHSLERLLGRGTGDGLYTLAFSRPLAKSNTVFMAASAQPHMRSTLSGIIKPRAAVNMQKAFRGFKARGRVLELEYTAMVKEYELKMKTGVTLIQKTWRGVLGRRRAKALREAHYRQQKEAADRENREHTMPPGCVIFVQNLQRKSLNGKKARVVCWRKDDAVVTFLFPKSTFAVPIENIFPSVSTD